MSTPVYPSCICVRPALAETAFLYLRANSTVPVRVNETAPILSIRIETIRGATVLPSPESTRLDLFLFVVYCAISLVCQVLNIFVQKSVGMAECCELTPCVSSLPLDVPYSTLLHSHVGANPSHRPIARAGLPYD